MRKNETQFNIEEYEEFYEDHTFQPLRDEDAMNAHRFLPRVNWALDVAKELKPKRILDLGCLDGYALLTLCKHAGSVEYAKGVDLSKDGINIARKRAESLEGIAIDFEQNTIEDFLENTKMKFDLIMLFEVIEHVKNPRVLLKLIDRVKAKDGQVLVSTPDFEAPTYGKDDEKNKCHIRLYSLADEDYTANNKYGTLRMATSMSKQVGKDRIIEMDTYSELINCRYK